MSKTTLMFTAVQAGRLAQALIGPLHHGSMVTVEIDDKGYVYVNGFAAADACAASKAVQA